MGDDDANDTPGVPGECPGHRFVLVGLQVSAAGAGMTHECAYCGALTYRGPGFTARGETSPGLDG